MDGDAIAMAHLTAGWFVIGCICILFSRWFAARVELPEDRWMILLIWPWIAGEAFFGKREL